LDSLTFFLTYFLFFFQAEDGIRDDLVTGVQTCALPISYQEGEGGIADALRLAEPFVEGEKICVVLGDNIIENNIIASKQTFEKQIGRASCRERVQIRGVRSAVEKRWEAGR